MNAVIGGWIAGYAMGLASTAALTFLATRMRDAAFVERWVARDVPGVLLAVPLFTGAALSWTMIGLLLGGLYEAGSFASKPGILGAPSWAFLLLVSALAWLPLPILVMVGRRYWWLWAAMSACFVGLFGWLMPLLAER
ncbi:MAG: hypothetical protein C0506_06810 [Anaerolinea sp.]|nr:hypothetical protein [Anaerolinea sp.]